jgi:hypothetical protein
MMIRTGMKGRREGRNSVVFVSVSIYVYACLF